QAPRPGEEYNRAALGGLLLECFGTMPQVEGMTLREIIEALEALAVKRRSPIPGANGLDGPHGYQDSAARKSNGEDSPPKNTAKSLSDMAAHPVRVVEVSPEVADLFRPSGPVPKGADEDQGSCIMHLGDRLYQIGESNPVEVNDSEHRLLQAFVRKATMT